MTVPGSYANGFAPRDGQPLYPELWRGCVGAWAPCLGPTGITLRDWSGYQRHGTLPNASVWQPNRMYLDRQQVVPAVSIPTPLCSISFWMFFDVASYAFPTQSAVIGSVANSSNPIFVRPSGANFFDGSFARLLNFTNTIQPRTVAHVVVNFETARISAWLNGVANGTVATVGSIASTGTQLTIGSFTGSNDFRGWIDDVRLYNRLLTEREITLLYSRRGIAYDLAPSRRSRIFTGGFKAYWAARKAQIIGGGL